MRRLLTILALAVVATGAISSVATGAGPHTEAISGRFHGMLSLAPTTDPYVVTGTDVATGEFSEIGRVNWVATETDSFATSTITDGLFTMHTPGGATISWAYSGTFAATGATTFSFSTHLTVTGGTGRFAGATGDASISGAVDVSTGSLDATFQGLLTLP